MYDYWDYGKEVLSILKKNNYEAYFVGGCVRDYLLDMKIHDIDITTSAKPGDVVRVFGRQSCVLVGEKYGTVSVKLGDFTFEVTTFRFDGAYSDSRHPNEVTFGVSAYEDVLRRDFTINGILMDEDLYVQDFVGGQQDLKKRIIRTIGKPDARFNEDALRILRAIYFQSKLNFSIDPVTQEAMKRLKDTILNISKERILECLIKICNCPHYQLAFKTMNSLGISQILPGISEGIHFLSTKEIKDFNPEIFFAVCFCLVGNVNNYYKFSNKWLHLFKTTIKLIKNYKDLGDYEVYVHGVKMCIFVSRVRSILTDTDHIPKKYYDIFDALPIHSEQDLAVSATEIIVLTNRKPAAWLGELITELSRLVIARELKNNRESILGYLKKKEYIV